MTARLALGAPGIYTHQRPSPAVLVGTRMDVCAFVGVAPKGPARQPKYPESWRFDQPCVHLPRKRSVAVPVESMDQYQRLYGGFDGPGRLPYVVDAFFKQGGRRAYIVRIVHDTGSSVDQGAVAKGVLAGAHSTTAGDLYLVARNEGAWGDKLRAALGFSMTALSMTKHAVAPTRKLIVDSQDYVPVGSLLRVTFRNRPREFRYVTNVRMQGQHDSTQILQVVHLDQKLTADPVLIEIVEGTLLIEDSTMGPTLTSLERHERLGLSSTHPRWMGTVLCNESNLVYPDASWVDGDIEPDNINILPITADLTRSDTTVFDGGQDLFSEIATDDFFDASWVLSNPEPGSGVHALTHLSDLSTVVVPDLYCPDMLPEDELVPDVTSLSGATFQPCVDLLLPSQLEQERATSELAGLRLDPLIQGELETIIKLQQKLVNFAELLQSFVVLLDVPPGLGHHQVLDWRSRFRSSYTAAYHPWLLASNPDDQRGTLISLNPSAVAAGVIAQQEIAFGVPHGPANVLAADALKLDQSVSPSRHDQLHTLGVNVFVAERDGVRLTAARTLASDARYRQLSVRRLMLMLRRVLSQQTQGLVFEPNTPALWADVRHLLRNYLRQLYRAGAFKGATESEAFFVQCDEQINSQQTVDAGKMIAHIGVSPSEPIEFIVLTLTRDGDGAVSVRE